MSRLIPVMLKEVCFLAGCIDVRTVSGKLVGVSRAAVLQSRVDEMELRIEQQSQEKSALKEELVRLETQLRAAKETIARLPPTPTTTTTNSPRSTTTSTSNSPTGKRGIALFQSPSNGGGELARLRGELSRTKALLDQAATNGHLLKKYIASRRSSLNGDKPLMPTSTTNARTVPMPPELALPPPPPQSSRSRPARHSISSFRMNGGGNHRPLEDEIN